MGRQQTIDRDKVLDAAESIIASAGVAALTIDAVAKAMGITKGGVQYCFGSKDAMIDALFVRWEQAYQTVFDSIAGEHPDPVTIIRAHMEATRHPDEVSSAKAASLMAGLARTPEHLAGTRDWYRKRIEQLDLRTPAGRQARLAFLATEGAFILRFFGFMPVEPQEWEDMFNDIQTLLPDEQA